MGDVIQLHTRRPLSDPHLEVRENTVVLCFGGVLTEEVDLVFTPDQAEQWANEFLKAASVARKAIL